MKVYKYLAAEALVPHSPSFDSSVRGRLRLGFERVHGATALTLCEQQPPLRVVRGFPTSDGGVLVHLHNLSGGVLGGDRLELTVDIGPESTVQLTSTGGTRLYRSRKEVASALQRNEIKVRAKGLLEYLPDPLIPFAGSRFRQETKIDLAQGAGLFWWETVAPGREARGELFAYERLEIKLDLTAEGKPVAAERLRLEPRTRLLASIARLGPYRYFSTFYICRVGWEPARWLALEEELGKLTQKLTRPSQTLWGVSTLPAHGLIVRALSCKGRDLSSGLLTVWRAAKWRLYGREAVPPRKVY